jgi:hypothetical protein
MPTQDEVLIRLRNGMNENEVMEALEKISLSLHRLLAVSIEGGAKANFPYLQLVMQSAGCLETAMINLRAGQQPSGLVRPQ